MSQPDAGNGRHVSVREVLTSPRWLRIEVLGGLVTALALIPEAISFAIVAGVDPRIGLFASVTMAVTIAITGGRPAMVSGAAGSTALVMAPLVASHGLDHLVAAVLLAGVIQIVFSVLGVAKLMRFVPRSVMVGFVNALAILIFSAQLRHLIGVPWIVYPLVVVGIGIIIGFPRLTRIIPAPLVAIVVLSVVVVVAGIDIPRVGDMGALPDSLPGLFVPDVPLSVDMLATIAPYALGMAMVGLLESLMTAKLVDDITDTHSNKTREGWGQGIANIVTGLFGGMGGCAMIGQTMINVKGAGARSRVSTFMAGVWLLILVMVSVMTFDWHSIRPRTLKQMPVSATVIMVVTVVATVLTDNLAIGVILGVVVAMVLFARRIAHFTEVVQVDSTEEGTKTYAVRGALFFASSNDLVYQFDYVGDPDEVVIDLSGAQIYDSSTVAALDAIELKYQQKGKQVTIVGLNEPSQRWHRLSGSLH